MLTEALKARIRTTIMSTCGRTPQSEGDKMRKEKRPLPDGFHTATMYLSIRDAAAAIDFYSRAFGAVELMRDTAPDGRIRHACFRVGDSPIMIVDDFEKDFSIMKCLQTMGGSPVAVFLYVDDADTVARTAIDAGATEVMPVTDKPYGRSGGVKDPFGLIWWITTP